ncbi:cilia- and flagella-associated protein 57-like [Octopus bimaculoides]|uniref:Uncharacterized protein n=1 Tax=Octopus bimaculoides TaxID=37653 RepID=A0A0L8G963_OCTBM|nr:cilia- and flagella-associated protein 57-like [Octopus bimaculoides]
MKEPISVKVTVSQEPETLHHVSFHPLNHLDVYVFGNRLLKLFRFVRNKHKQFNFPKIVPQDFKCYSWDAKQRLLVGTGSGRVLCIEGRYLKLDFNVFQYLNLPNDAARMHGVTAIVSYSHGFITACGTKYVQFFESIDNDNYKFVRDVLLPSDTLENNKLCDQIIKWMVVNPSEEVLVISTNMKQMYSTQVNPPETKNKTESNVFDVLVQPFHYKHITGCCVSLWKPFIATSSLDGSIKVWNRETFNLEFSKNFSEEVYSISMHPMGLFLLAGFSDELRFMYILRDDFKLFRDINIRRCTHCNFSRGGHMFAAVNNNFIQVYSSITFEMLANLKGHNGKVQATAWCMDDNNLISCGLDGAVYEWEIKTEKRIGECVLKSCACNDVAVNTDNKKLYVVSSDRSLNEIHKSNILQTFLSRKFLYTSVALSWSNTMLFVGTNDGYIRSMACPPIRGGKWCNYPCHSLETTHMIFTTDDRYLISTSRDASIAIWKVNNAEDENLKSDQGTVYPNEILIPKSDVEKRNCLISKLKIHIEELENEMEYKMRLKTMNYNKINEISENNQKIEILKVKNEILEKDKSKQEAECIEEISHINENHSQELQLIESVTDKKLLEEDENCKNLENMLIVVQEKNKQEIKELEEKQEILFDQLIEEYEKKLVDLEKKMEQCTENILLQQKECEEMQKRIEVDAEMELVSRKTNFEQLLFQERDFTSELKHENSVLKKKVLKFSTKLKASDEECNNYKLGIERLKIIINRKEDWIKHLGEVLHIREEKPRGEGKHFYDLVQKNMETMKLKTDLDFKHIIELRQCLQEREDEINTMRVEMKIMQRQQEKLTNQLTNRDCSTKETKQKLVATSRELDRVRTRLDRKSALLYTFYSDLVDCISFIDDHQKLKGSIKALYEKYNQKNIKKIIASYKNRNVSIHKKWNRQRYNFEYMVHKLKIITKDTVEKVTLQNCVLTTRSNIIREKLSLVREKNRFLLP